MLSLNHIVKLRNQRVLQQLGDFHLLPHYLHQVVFV